jgi:hypothetical protein
MRELLPLSRLRRSGVHAAVGDRADLAALEALLISLDGNSPRPAQVPASLLDACRFGARACVGRLGAARAVLGQGGVVRPCTRGERIGDAVEDTAASLGARLDELAAEREAARGCGGCAAREVCSRCLFPAVLSDDEYCGLVRAHAERLPRLRRLLDAVEQLDEMGVAAGRLTIEVWPAPVSDGDEPFWTVERGGRVFLQRGAPRRIVAVDAVAMLPPLVEVPPLGAAVALAIARGATSRAAVAERGWAAHPPEVVEPALDAALAALSA